MLSSLTRNWWIAAVRGVIAIGIGVATFVWPGVTLATLVYLFGAYTLLDGITSLGLGLLGLGSNERWWAAVLSGIVGVLAGVVTFVQPAATALALVYLIAAWALVTGGLQILAAVRLRAVIADEWLMALGGALSMLFGVLLVTAPASGALTLVFLFGYYTLSTGLAQVALGLRLRALAQPLPRRHAAAATSTAS